MADDVRMRGFKKRSPVQEALDWVDSQSIDLPEEIILIQNATGRVLAGDIVSTIDIPGFDRSMMDGYAIVASDAQGASAYNQLQLQLIGRSMPGRGADVKVSPGTAVKIMTGAPVPEGANAVLPAENVEIDEPFVFVSESVAEGRNIGREGEDVASGSTLLKQGRRLRPQDIALLASIGREEVSVLRRLRISIIITGNEILPIGETPQVYQIVNSNGPMLESLSCRDGGVIVSSRIVPDDVELIRQAMLEEYDILLITGGTSVGEEDRVPLILAECGELVIHGIAMRPSRSAGMGRIGEQCVFLLPGNPVACLCAYDFFAGHFIRECSGLGTKPPYRSEQKILKQKITSMIGRTDYARVRFSSDAVEPLAISGAGILTSTTQADGFIIIPADKEGYSAGTEVEVFLYD